MKTLIHKKNSREGATLFIVVLTLVVLGIFSTTFFLRNSVNIKMTRNYQQSSDAFYDAYAGVEYVMERIKADLAASIIGLNNSVESVYYAAPAGWNFDTVTTLTRLPDGKSYSFHVVGNQGDARAKIEAVVKKPPGFDYDIFGEDVLTFSGNSSVNGSMRGNKNIKVTGPVSGDAIPGPGYTVDNPGLVAGSSNPATSLYVPDPIPAADVTDAMTNNDNNLIPGSYLSGDKLTVSGDTLTLTSGTYFFSEATFSGGAILNINGKVVIYVTGKWTMSGGGITNPNMNPNDLMVWNTTTDKVTISGSSASYGHFYAPNAKEIVISGGGTYHGVLYSGGKVTFSGGSHYGGSGGGGSGDGLEVVYWRQIFD